MGNEIAIIPAFILAKSGKNKINLVAGAIAEPFADMVWLTLRKPCKTSWQTKPRIKRQGNYTCFLVIGFLFRNRRHKTAPIKDRHGGNFCWLPCLSLLFTMPFLQYCFHLCDKLFFVWNKKHTGKQRCCLKDHLMHIRRLRCLCPYTR